MASGPRDLAQLQLLPEDDRVGSLIARREDQWFERVSSRIHPRELADLLVGFANGEGGLIVVGIHDGQIEGVGQAGGRMNAWRQTALDFTDPAVRHRVKLVPCTNQRGDSDEVAIFEVEASDRVHLNRKGDTFLRVGDENRRLSIVEAQELRYDKGDSVFDGTPAQGTTFADLDEKLVQKFLRRVRATSDPALVLPARGLAMKDGKRPAPTVAGVLILGHDPQQFLPQAYLRLLQYKGSSRETGARSNVVRDQRIGGPLSMQVNAARRLLRRWIDSANRASGHSSETQLITTDPKQQI